MGTEEQTDGQTDRQTNGLTDDGEKDGGTDKLVYRDCFSPLKNKKIDNGV